MYPVKIDLFETMLFLSEMCPESDKRFKEETGESLIPVSIFSKINPT